MKIGRRSFIKKISLVLETKRVENKFFWSGRRDSNPRLQPWQGCALPLSYARKNLLLFVVFYKLPFIAIKLKGIVVFVVKGKFDTI